MLQFFMWRKKDSFSSEFAEHIDSLYSTAMRLTRNPADAEDLVQETALKAFRARENYQTGTNRRAWLFKIMMNTFINKYHRDKRERLHFDKNFDFGDIEERFVCDWQQSPFGRDNLTFSEGMSDEVAQAFQALPDHFRSVVELVDLQDFSYAEAAEIIGHPIGTVMSRLSRGRKLLQNELRDYARREGIIENSENGEKESEKRPRVRSIKDVAR